MSEKRYINFPVQLLNNFLVDHKECLDNIMDYGVYTHAYDHLEYGDKSKAFKDAAKYFSIKYNNLSSGFDNGKSLHDEFYNDSPKVGISTNMIWDFFHNNKSEFEKVCLLGYLAIKSILQNKSYCKITNNFWLARMDGNTHTVSEIYELSDSIKKYSNEYQTKKIKTELIHNWGLVHYSRYMRGFYVSFKLDKDELVYQAEKQRKSTKEKQLKFAEKLALEKALERLNKEPP